MDDTDFRDQPRGSMKGVGDFLRNVVQRKEGGLVGRTFKVGAYTIRVEAHLGDGGFATIYRARDTSTMTAFALKHVRMGGEPDAVADCHTEVCYALTRHSTCGLHHETSSLYLLWIK